MARRQGWVWRTISLGKSPSFVNGTSVEQHKRSKSVGCVRDDTWKVNQRLTLNYGLRWEPYFPSGQPGSAARIHFDEDALKKGIKTQPVHERAAGLVLHTAIPDFRAGPACTTSGGISRRASDSHGM